MTVSPCSRRRRTAARSAGSSLHGARIAAASRRGGKQRRDRLDVQAEADRRSIAPEDRADLVVPAAAQQGIARAWRIDREARAAVVGIAAEIGQVDAELHLRMDARDMLGERGADRPARAAVRAAAGSSRRAPLQHIGSRRTARAGWRRPRRGLVGKPAHAISSAAASLAANAATTLDSRAASAGEPPAATRTMRVSPRSSASSSMPASARPSSARSITSISASIPPCP